MTTELVALADVDTTSQAYTDAKTFIEGIQNEYKAKADEVVATSSVDLTINDPATGKRAVRSAETNLGDLCADAYRTLLEADVAFVNGGGVRDNIAAGDITYGDIIAVHPFGNLACLVEVSGQQILDALELGSMQAGVSESGGFLQVSGLKYTIDTSIPSTVELDDAGNFVKVAGDRRVKDVQILDSETGTYTAIDPKATYTLASHNYMLKDGGDGYAMFGADNVKILKDEVMVDNEVLINYIKDELGGVVGEQYANPRGDGRIKVLYADTDFTAWYAEAVRYVTSEGLMSTTNGSSFSPAANVTVASVYQMLYNMEGKPAVEKATVAGTEGSGTPTASTGLLSRACMTPRPPLPATALLPALRWRPSSLTTPPGRASRPLPTTAPMKDKVPDYASIPAEDLDGMTFCYYAGLMTGNQNHELMPTSQLSRAEFAQLLMNFDGFLAEQTPAAA